MPLESAGILVFRLVKVGAEVLLVHPGGPYYVTKDEWSIPKGELDPDEDHLAAAFREFAEEVGVVLPQRDCIDLGSARQTNGKVNFIWALEYEPDLRQFKSNTCMIEWPPRSGRQLEIPEVDKAEWYSLTEAKQKLYSSQTIFIDRLAEHLGLTLI